MEATERALFEGGVRRATEANDGAALDSALREVGWRDALGGRPADRRVGAVRGAGSDDDHLGRTRLAAGDRPRRRRWRRSRWRRSRWRRGRGRPPVARPRRRPGASGRGLVRGRRARDRRSRPWRHGTRRGPDARWCRHLRRGPRPPDASAGARPRSGARPVRSRGRIRDSVGGAAQGRRLAGRGRPGTTRTRARAGRCRKDDARAARTHALERVQFGRPIGSFQAVRHRLAESLVALEAAAALLDAAWEDLCPSPPPWQRRSPAARRAPWPGTASRCWPVSASRPSTRCTDPSGGRSPLISCSVPGALTRTLGADILSSATPPAAFPL